MGRITRRTLIASVIAPMAVSAPIQASASRGVVQTPVASKLQAKTSVTSTFPIGVTLDTDLPISAEDVGGRIELETRIPGSGDTWMHVVLESIVQAQDPTHLTIALDLQSAQIPPGLELESSWRIIRTDGSISRTEPHRYWWRDDRWPWQSEETESAVIHAFNANTHTVSTVRDSIETTVRTMSSRFNIPISDPFQVWLYPSNDAFRDVLLGNSRDSIAAVSYPEFGYTAGLITDNNPAEVGRVFPHELSHLMLYRATSSAFAFVPLWFDEGLATNIQSGGTSNFPNMVRSALRQRKLFHLRSLAEAFPYDAAGATLGYAASFSAVSFLMEQWEDAKLAALIAGFNQGIGVDNAMQAALGLTLDQFDQAWKTWISA